MSPGTRVSRPLFWTGFLVIVLERVAIPIGPSGTSVSALIFLASMIVLHLRGRIPIVASGLAAYVLFLAVGLISALRATDIALGSAASLMFLALLYFPLIFVGKRSGEGRGWGVNFVDGVVTATSIGVALAFVQAVAQWVGMGFLDPVSRLPEALRVAGFNSRYDTAFVNASLGMGTKPNGMIFLEPSFLSLLAAFAAVCVLWRILSTAGRARRRDSMLFLWLLGGVAISISTSGLPVLAFGLLPVLWRFLNRRIAVATLAVLAIAAYAGFLDGVVGKATEGFSSRSSTGLRLVVPYQLLPDRVFEAPVFGHGPGTADAIAMSTGLTQLQAPTPLKVALEYGLLGLIVWSAIVILVVASSSAPWSVKLAVLAAYLIPGEMLLNPLAVTLLLGALPYWGYQPVEGTPGTFGKQLKVRTAPHGP